MKTFKKMTSLCVVALMLTLPSFSFASGNSGTQVPLEIQVNQNGRILVLGTNDWANPDSCLSSRFVAILPIVGSTVNEFYSEMYALLVASYLQGKSVNGWLIGCTDFNNVTVPILRNITSN